MKAHNKFSKTKRGVLKKESNKTHQQFTAMLTMPSSPSTHHPPALEPGFPRCCQSEQDLGVMRSALPAPLCCPKAWGSFC